MGASPAEGSRSISRSATEISEWSRPGTWTLREAGNGPVVTRSSSTFGMSFADGSGAESGIWISVAPVERRPGSICEEEVGFCRSVPVPTPARPGSGSKGFRAPIDYGPAASRPLAGAPLGRSDYLQSARRPSRLRFDDAKPSSSDVIRLDPGIHVPDTAPVVSGKAGSPGQAR